MDYKAPWIVAAALAALWAATVAAATSPLRATIIDRYGNQHDVAKFTFQGRQDLEVYFQVQRRLVAVSRLRD